MATERRVTAVRLNAALRQLTDAQKALLGQQIEGDIAALAKQRQTQALRRGEQPGVPSRSNDHDGEIRTPEADLTRSQVAREVGLGSGMTYQRHKQVIAQAREEAPPALTPSQPPPMVQ